MSHLTTIRTIYAAFGRGDIATILSHLDDPLLAPSTKDVYDVRVWGHCYALDLLCRLREMKRMGGHGADIERWIPRLTQTLVDASAHTTGPVWELFNPFSPASQSNYVAALTNLALGVLAVFAVILAVAVLEYSRPAITRALQIIVGTGRALGVVLILFLLSLAVLNALLILTNV